VRRIVAILALVVACTGPAPAVVQTPSPSREPGVLTVAVFLDLSGPRSALGVAQRNAIDLWADEQRANRIPVKVRTVDVGDSDARLFLELRRAAVDDPVDAAVVGTPVAWDDTLGRALDLAAFPVLFTLPLAADPVARVGGRWAFAMAPSISALAASEVDDARRRGALSPSLILTPPATRVDPTAAALDAELARRSLPVITHVALAADGSVPPVVRSGLSVLRSVHCTAPPLSCAAVADAARAAGAPTFFYLPYTTAPSEVSDRPGLAARAVWLGSARTLPFDAPPVMPVNQARDRFLRTYGERWGAAGTQAATAYDALSLLVAAADRAGADDPASLRDALERITMPLIASTYSFGPARHSGPDPADLAYLRWTGSAVAPALSPSLGTGLVPVRPSATP
jgi:ABC-type branched-subunit amino acid transport system substrate-binding protein